MRPTSRLALAAACACALAVPAVLAAAPVPTTIRVEGAAATILPETAVTLDDTPGASLTVRDTLDADTVTVPATSATAQLGAATAAAGLPLGLQIFAGLGSFATQIGPDAQPSGTFTPGVTPTWRLKIGHRVSDVGQDAALLAPGSTVLWSFGPSFEERELDLAVSADRVSAGGRFDVSVVSYDNAGTPVPAAGAEVHYGDQAAIADDAGRVSFSGTGEGVKLVTATRAGEVRSPARTVCSFAANPAVCNLPPAAQPGAPAPAATGTTAPAATASGAQTADSTPAGSRIGYPLAGRRYLKVRAVRGQAGPDRSDVARVEVALAQRVGTQCRFRGPGGRFGVPTACARQRFLRARSAGGNWLLPLGRGLRPGLYRVWSRAVDGAGNRESVGIAGVNTLQFRVGRARSASR
jgi:hypothetical protein